MSRKYKARDPEGVYFITCTVVGWVDLFTRPVYKDIIIDSLNFCIDKKGLKVHAFVIMTSHLHLIVSTKEGGELASIMRDFKSFTSKELIKAIGRINESRREWILNKLSFEANRKVRGKNYKLWQDGYHAIELTNGKMVKQKLAYIHANPVAERIVEEEEDYVYSSAKQYAGRSGEMKIEML